MALLDAITRIVCGFADAFLPRPHRLLRVGSDAAESFLLSGLDNFRGPSSRSASLSPRTQHSPQDLRALAEAYLAEISPRNAIRSSTDGARYSMVVEGTPEQNSRRESEWGQYIQHVPPGIQTREDLIFGSSQPLDQEAGGVSVTRHLPVMTRSRIYRPVSDFEDGNWSSSDEGGEVTGRRFSGWISHEAFRAGSSAADVASFMQRISRLSAEGVDITPESDGVRFSSRSTMEKEPSTSKGVVMSANPLYRTSTGFSDGEWIGSGNMEHALKFTAATRPSADEQSSLFHSPLTRMASLASSGMTGQRISSRRASARQSHLVAIPEGEHEGREDTLSCQMSGLVLEPSYSATELNLLDSSPEQVQGEPHLFGRVSTAESVSFWSERAQEGSLWNSPATEGDNRAPKLQQSSQSGTSTVSLATNDASAAHEDAVAAGPLSSPCNKRAFPPRKRTAERDAPGSPGPAPAKAGLLVPSGNQAKVEVNDAATNSQAPTYSSDRTSHPGVPGKRIHHLVTASSAPPGFISEAISLARQGKSAAAAEATGEEKKSPARTGPGISAFGSAVPRISPFEPPKPKEGTPTPAVCEREQERGRAKKTNMTAEKLQVVSRRVGRQGMAQEAGAAERQGVAQPGKRMAKGRGRLQTTKVAPEPQNPPQAAKAKVTHLQTTTAKSRQPRGEMSPQKTEQGTKAKGKQNKKQLQGDVARGGEGNKPTWKR